MFKNVPSSIDNFPELRVLGTIGWIAAGLSLRLLIKPGQQVNNRPLLLASALSLVLGVYSLFLPHTPPTADAGGEIPFIKAFRMFEQPAPAVFLAPFSWSPLPWRFTTVSPPCTWSKVSR